MNFYIAFSPDQHQGGGGSVFLQTLAAHFRSRGLLATQPSAATVIIFNSHHDLQRVAWLRYRYPLAVFIHRVDGPMSVYTARRDRRDYLVKLANHYLADGIVFQSAWSAQENTKQRLVEKLPYAIIHNAPDPRYFNRHNIESRPHAPVRLVASSWSANSQKGFTDYHWLDDNLDFQNIQFTFIGNTDYPFRRIRHIQLTDRAHLADELKQQDIFIFASRFEACSNALLEALACGLPAIAYAGSSNPELIRDGGLLYTQPQQIPHLLAKLTADYSHWQQAIRMPVLSAVADQYVAFSERLARERSVVSARQLTWPRYAQFQWKLWQTG